MVVSHEFMQQNWQAYHPSLNFKFRNTVTSQYESQEEFQSIALNILKQKKRLTHLHISFLAVQEKLNESRSPAAL